MMGVQVRITCNGGMCPSYHAFDVVEDLMTTHAGFVVDTEWIPVPGGWELRGDGYALCPLHREAT